MHSYWLPLPPRKGVGKEEGQGNGGSGKEGLQPLLNRARLVVPCPGQGVRQGCAHGCRHPCQSAHHPVHCPTPSTITPRSSTPSRLTPCPRFPATLTASSVRQQWLVLGEFPASAGESIRSLTVRPLSLKDAAVRGGAETASRKNVVETAAEGSRTDAPDPPCPVHTATWSRRRTCTALHSTHATKHPNIVSY